MGNKEPEFHLVILNDFGLPHVVIEPENETESQEMEVESANG
ncbi:hypothetical protein ACU3L3_13970 [Priestia endophytica]|jgi:hypothetical protein|uniref:Uncharacterized protein n=1 Tax=Priestia endophytica DSM 13796 TaxID=1121089 RepID=A0A1I6BUK8_9BACI|nr:hypothetical protein [Priestia endophytica]SFQ84622.1 hypothetical protein SAMN02745910_04232 [Priestia endophytica DSM 13796]